jgi:hypothetical protein
MKIFRGCSFISGADQIGRRVFNDGGIKICIVSAFIIVNWISLKKTNSLDKIFNFFSEPFFHSIHHEG